VVKVLKPGTYKLANEDGEELTNTWNIQQCVASTLKEDFQVLFVIYAPTPQLAVRM
jgi:hypothetical protein